MRHVFLNPDGSASVFGVIVRASTGVMYEHQCAGLATDMRREEGFFVPIADHDARDDVTRSLHAELVALFDEYRGNVPSDLPTEFQDRLEATIARIPFWKTTEGGKNERSYLQLDRARQAELTEAWVPVTTSYRGGVLVFDNCD